MRLEEELKMDAFGSPYQRVLLNLMFTGAWWEAKVRETLKEYRLTEQQYNVLRILRGKKGDCMNLYMIQERMLHRRSNATRIVERLRQKALVEREICSTNRRQVEVSITEKGLKLLEELDPSMKALEEQLAGELDPNEVEQLHELLERVRVEGDGSSSKEGKRSRTSNHKKQEQ